MKPNDMASLTCSCGRPSEHESGSCVACVYKAEVDSLKAQLKHCRESRADEGLSAMEELVELRADVDRLSANDELQKQSIVALLAQVKAITTERDEEAMLREKYWLDMETAKVEVVRLTKERDAAVTKEADTWANWESRVAALKEQIREEKARLGAVAIDLKYRDKTINQLREVITRLVNAEDARGGYDEEPIPKEIWDEARSAIGEDEKP